MDPWILEAIGYVASVLVAVSLMMSSILRLRVINLLGSATFTVYGVLIQAYPVAAVNAFIVVINLYYLRGMLQTEAFFRILEVPQGSEYLRAFLAYHREDIERFMPGFVTGSNGPSLALFVLRDMVPAGLLLGDVDGQTLRLRLDYVIPQYRDFKVGRYLFEDEAAFFRAQGISEIVSPPGSTQHAAYLRRMGFERAPGGGGEQRTYRLVIE